MIEDRVDQAYLDHLVFSVGYGGNPEHKKDAGNFELQTSTAKRADYSLCDFVAISKRAVALDALRVGIKRRLISKQRRNGFPQNVWSLTESGVALEAQLENETLGTYHGYPMDPEDPFVPIVKAHWDANCD
jgi:hypothetical protein